MQMKNNLQCRVIIILLSLTFPFASTSFALGNNYAGFIKAEKHWTILGGYSVTHPGFGDTDTRVQGIDLVFQYGRFLFKEAGRSWYKTRHEILIEIPLSAVYYPERAIMAGINFLACWNFIASEKMIPFVFAGGGPLYTNLDIPGLGSEFNGSYQAGAGVRYLIGENISIDFNYRLHHISNADTAEPNEPLNASKFLFGITFFK